MIFEQERVPKSIIGYRLFRIFVWMTKIIAIYVMLAMAYSFSFMFFIIMIFGIFLCHKMTNSLQNFPSKMVFTPLNQLKEGIVKVQGRADVKDAIIAPLDNRSCIGYGYCVFDMKADDGLSLVKEETVFNDFILFADGKHIDVKAEKIDFDIMMTEYLERDVGDQKHVQKTLCQSDQVIIVADAVLKDDGTYQLNYTKKKDKLIVQIKQDSESINTRRKSRAYFSLIFFIVCIAISLLLIGYVGKDWHNQWAIFWTFDQLLFGHSFGFDNGIAFYVNLPEYFGSIIQSRDVMPIILMITSSFIISYILFKLTKFFSRADYFSLSNYLRIFAIIILIDSIICLISGFILLLSADKLFFFKLVSIFITLLSFGLLSMFIFWVDNRLSIDLTAR